jgi:hypothetical protein
LRQDEGRIESAFVDPVGLHLKDIEQTLESVHVHRWVMRGALDDGEQVGSGQCD